MTEPQVSYREWHQFYCFGCACVADQGDGLDTVIDVTIDLELLSVNRFAHKIHPHSIKALV